MSEGETKEPFSEAWQKRNQINPRENPSEGRGNTSSARRATRVASRRCEDRLPCGAALDRGSVLGTVAGFSQELPVTRPRGEPARDRQELAPGGRTLACGVRGLSAGLSPAGYDGGHRNLLEICLTTDDVNTAQMTTAEQRS